MQSHQPPRLDLPPEESTDLEELEQFAKMFKQKRIKLGKGPFKYYVIKEVGGWGQKTAIFDDLQYCKSSEMWVGGPKKAKNMMR